MSVGPLLLKVQLQPLKYPFTEMLELQYIAINYMIYHIMSVRYDILSSFDWPGQSSVVAVSTCLILWMGPSHVLILTESPRKKSPFVTCDFLYIF